MLATARNSSSWTGQNRIWPVYCHEYAFVVVMAGVWFCNREGYGTWVCDGDLCRSYEAYIQCWVSLNEEEGTEIARPPAVVTVEVAGAALRLVQTCNDPGS